MPCTRDTRTTPFQRVWIALLELETPFTHEIIDLSDKPSEFLRLSEVASGGRGTSTVPLLEMGEDVVCASSGFTLRAHLRHCRASAGQSQATALPGLGLACCPIRHEPEAPAWAPS